MRIHPGRKPREPSGFGVTYVRSIRGGDGVPSAPLPAKPRAQGTGSEEALRAPSGAQGAGLGVGRRVRVAVVGPCASGKTTLVGRLRAVGVEAKSIAQEHSGVSALYERTPADVLVYLDVSLGAVRARREVSWGPERLEAEARRLTRAREAADLVIDTDSLSAEGVLGEVLRFLEARCEAGDGARARPDGQGPTTV